MTAELRHVIAVGDRTGELDGDARVVKSLQEHYVYRCAAPPVGGCKSCQHEAGLVRDHVCGRKFTFAPGSEYCCNAAAAAVPA